MPSSMPEGWSFQGTPLEDYHARMVESCLEILEPLVLEDDISVNDSTRRALSGNSRSKNTNQNQPPNRGNTGSPTAYGGPSMPPPNMPAAPASPSLTTAMTTNDQAHQNNQGSKKVPFFFREEYAGLIVKGNFMTLAAQPHAVEEGEWLAHQIVEQNRLLSGMLKCMQEKDRTSGRPTCNDQSCPAMTAGPTTYTWIDTKGNPINLPAPMYIKHIQTWVNGKIQDPKIFINDQFTSAPQIPNSETVMSDPDYWRGKTSGFPKRFEHEIKNMYKQMFRCYAHLFYQHWLNFWELGISRDLNTCFVHFINVGRLYNLLNEKDVEPMAPLVDIWIKQGVLPTIKPVDGPLATEGSSATPKSAGGDAAAGPSGGGVPGTAS